MKNLFIIVLAVFAFVGISCSNSSSFNSEKWKEKGLDWMMSDTREKMLDDLINSDTLIGKSHFEVNELLGVPEIKSQEELKYLVREKYGNDIDPEYIKYLKVQFDEKTGYVKNLKIVQ